MTRGDRRGGLPREEFFARWRRNPEQKPLLSSGLSLQKRNPLDAGLPRAASLS
jgi:hypothetical protein